MTIATVSVSGGETTQIKSGDITIQMFRSYKYTGTRDGLEGFLPSEVLRGSQVVWSFKDRSKSFGYMSHGSIGELMNISTDEKPEYIIVIRGRESISDVVVINDFTHGFIGTMSGSGKKAWIPGNDTTSIEERLDIKLTAARDMNLFPWLTPEETEILRLRKQADIAARAKAQAAAKEAKEEESTARALARHAKTQAILERKKVEGHALDGRKLFGVPILDDEEWKSLRDDTHCVMMKNGIPQHAFIVSKHGSSVGKRNETPIVAENPQLKNSDVGSPEVLEVRKIKIKGVPKNVIIFASFAGIKAAQAAGLNSGTLAGHEKENGEIEVVAISAGTIKTVGIIRQVT